MSYPFFSRLSVFLPGYPFYLTAIRFFFNFRRKQKKDPYYTKTRLTRYLGNSISQNCTNKSQKWLYEIIRFLKIFKILPSLFVNDNRKGPYLRQSSLNFQTLNFHSLGLPAVGLMKGQYILVGEARRKKGKFFPVFHSWDFDKKRLLSLAILWQIHRLSC